MRNRRSPRLAAVLVVLAACVFTAHAAAAPADPTVVETLTQPDGTTLQVRLWGDEFAHGYETLDGYTVVLDPKDKTWKYAERDARGQLKPSKLVAKKAKEKPQKHLRPTRDAINAARTAEGAALLGAPSLDAAPPWAGNDTDVLFIMVEFTDLGCSFTPAQMQANMFGATSSGPGNLTDYYDEISYGALQLDGTVVGNNGNTDCVALANNRDFYNNDGSNADGDDDLVREAVGIVDAYVDFTQYDNDGDGSVDALGIIYAGGGPHDGCATGTNDDNLWPHSGRISNPGPTVDADGVTVNPFIINSEVTYPLATPSTCNVMQTIGLFAHEFGHSLGLPDLYDTDVGFGGVDTWSTMAFQYLGTVNNSDTPPHFDPWSKAFLGWVTPTVHAAGDRFVESLSQVETSGEVHQFLDNPGGFETGGSGEYFLVENRQQVLFDSQIAGCGLLVWHIDEAQTDNDSGGHSAGSHRLVDIDEADGLAELDTNGSADAGDPFPGSTNNTLFGDTTNPSSDLYDGSSSGVRMRVLTTSCAAGMSAAFGPNQPPVADADGPYVTNEGSYIGLTAAGSSDADGDALTYAWDLDNDGQFDDSTSQTPSFGNVGDNGVFTVRVRVTDSFGDSDTDTSTVTVNNVAPTIPVLNNDGPVAENTMVSIAGLVSDAGWLDVLTATVDWGDGAGPQPLAGLLENTEPLATLAFAAGHVYGDNGVFTVTVCASDDDGAVTAPCATTLVTITNVVPTATIDESATVIVNGVPTIVAEAGESVSLSGRSTDPGSEDLTLTWIWDDGSPNTSTLYRVNPPTPDGLPSPSIQPRDVTDTQSHAFAACLYDVGFRASDDDGGISPIDTVTVLITGTSTLRFSAGYWHQQYRDKNGFYADETLACYLEIAGFVSDVFDEVVDASTVPKARNVLKPGGNTSAIEQFDRQLLAVLLNVANGAPDLDELIDTDGDGTPDTALLAVIEDAEAVRLNLASTTGEILAQKNLLERINLGQA